LLSLSCLKSYVKNMKKFALTVVTYLEIRVAVPMQDGIVMRWCMRHGGCRRWDWAVLTFRIGGEVKCHHAVGWASRIVASDIELRSREGDDVLRNYARVKLKEQWLIWEYARRNQWLAETIYLAQCHTNYILSAFMFVKSPESLQLIYFSSSKIWWNIKCNIFYWFCFIEEKINKTFYCKKINYNRI